MNVRSLRSRMMLWAFMLLLPILLLFLLSNRIAIRSLRDQVQANVQRVITPFAREIDVKLENIRRYIASKRLDLSALKARRANEMDALKAIRDIGDGFAADLTVYAQIDAIFLYFQDEMWFVQNYNRSYASQRKAAQAMEAYLRVREPSAPLFQTGFQSLEAEGTYYLFLAIDLPEGGVLGCWFNADTLLAPVRDSKLDGLSQAMLVDRTGRWMNAAFDTRSARRLNEALAGYLSVTEQLTSGAFTLTALLDERVVYAPLRQLNDGLLLSLACALVLFIVYIGFVRQSIIKPLNRLAHFIRGIKTGDFQPIPIRGKDAVEILDVYQAINKMIMEVETLKIRVYEEKLAQHSTRMQMFQLQLRPHFFLNALNAILGFARANEYASLQRMTLSLAAHCRYILYNNWFVSVEEELEYTQNFIDMQSLQHDTRYKYSADADADTLERELPILSIQIFVENALKHSRGSATDLTIRVTVRLLQREGEKRLYVCVDDSGAGFSETMLRRLNGAKFEPDAGEDQGVGVENIRNRLALLYTEQALITFSNNSCGGARVEMTLPLERKGTLAA